MRRGPGGPPGLPRNMRRRKRDVCGKAILSGWVFARVFRHRHRLPAREKRISGIPGPDGLLPGGRRPALDTGTLGEARVREVHQRDGEIWHDTDRPLEVGSTVAGRIDWDRRFDLMQQHSGEHMVSGIVHARFGCDNVGFHMGADVITMDFNREITPEELSEVEAEVNRRIWEDVPVRIFCPDQEELERLSYRSKKELSAGCAWWNFREPTFAPAADSTWPAPARSAW